MWLPPLSPCAQSSSQILMEFQPHPELFSLPWQPAIPVARAQPGLLSWLTPGLEQRTGMSHKEPKSCPRSCQSLQGDGWGSTSLMSKSREILDV